MCLWARSLITRIETNEKETKTTDILSLLYLQATTQSKSREEGSIW